MSMRYTGKNWKEVREVWRKNPNITTLESIIEAKKQTEDKAHKAFMMAARDSGAIDNGKILGGDMVMSIMDHCRKGLRGMKLSKVKEGDLDNEVTFDFNTDTPDIKITYE